MPLLPPPVNGIAIVSSGAPALLGVDDATALAWNERTVGELVLGTGSFELGEPPAGPGFAPDERHHLEEARTLLRLALGAGLAGLVVLVLVLGRADMPATRAARWRRAGRTAGLVMLVTGWLGVLATVAFDPLFELFHRIAFPGGGWAFDPSVSRLVRLYPFLFWQQMAAALVLGLMGWGLIGWWVARGVARRADHG